MSISKEVLDQARRVFCSHTSSQPTPDGWLPVEAWSDGKRVVICGTPADDEASGLPEEEWHNCDVMGCGSIGPHIVGIFELPNAIQLPTRKPFMEWLVEDYQPEHTAEDRQARDG
jgi:hypothetical protein